MPMRSKTMMTTSTTTTMTVVKVVIKNNQARLRSTAFFLLLFLQVCFSFSLPYGRSNTRRLDLQKPKYLPTKRHVLLWHRIRNQGQEHETSLQQQQQQQQQTALFSTLNDRSDNNVGPTDSVETDNVWNNFCKSDRLVGLSVLLTAPIIWGTYNPVIKFVYTAIDPPIPGFVFSTAYFLVSAAALWLLVFIQGQQVQPLAKRTKTTTTIPSQPLKQATNDSSTTSTKDKLVMSNNNFATLLGGLELGLYSFIGNNLQIIGLQSVPASRAGFLVQLTTVLVPILQALLLGSVQSVPVKTWLSCLLAFVGVVVMDLDKGNGLAESLTTSTSTTSIATSLFQRGDFLIFLATLMYSLHVVRMEPHAKRTQPAQLSACKSTVVAVLNVVLVAALVATSKTNLFAESEGLLGFCHETGTSIINYFSSMTELLFSSSNSVNVQQTVVIPTLAAVLWTGVVTSGYTNYAQSFGQRRVSPADANLIYTLQPLITSIFAFLLLGETFGPMGAVGGLLIALAVLSVALDVDFIKSSSSIPSVSPSVLKEVKQSTINGDSSTKVDDKVLPNQSKLLSQEMKRR